MTNRARIATRSDYRPSVRPRPAEPRDVPDPLPHHTPVRARPPTSVKRTWITMSTSTLRQTLLIPTTDYRVRLHRIWLLISPAEASDMVLELYFGTGTDAAANRSKIIDMAVIKTALSVGTRTYDVLSVARAPTGLINESVSYRWQTAPVNAHRAFVEYTEEIIPGRAV